MSYQKALQLLRQGVSNPVANFHEHQWEAIDTLVNKRGRLLCIQKTGWGKSSVYFIATKLMREQGLGPAVIISPLLALIRNQVESAARYGVRLGSINSSQTKYENDTCKANLLAGHLDAVIISPEQLAKDEVRAELLIPVQVSLFVIDEAHCISDWGHDFRPDYKRISRVINHMPVRMPILATTATANERVTRDIAWQMGEQITTLRGALTRHSIHLQNIHLPKRSQRLAWLANALPTIAGTGIIYTATIHDAFQVAEWLRQCGISAQAYAGRIPKLNKEENAAKRRELETALLNDRLKVLVSTSALGMGFDKGNLAFVIHYQSPGSVVGYYQQVGRAGRSINKALGILMSGDEDAAIQRFFINNAFPTAELVSDLLSELEKSDGLKKTELEARLNHRPKKIEMALNFLSAEDPPPIDLDGRSYKRTIHEYDLPEAMIERLSNRKEQEWQEIQNYLLENRCLMQFLAKKLDDNLATPCGKCANCDPNNALPIDYPPALGQQAVAFLGNTMIPIEPKKQAGNGRAKAAERFPAYQFPSKFGELAHEPGAMLCRWREAGWGELAAAGKRNQAFDPRLADACVKMLYERWQPDPMPTWITYVPSLNHPNLVKNFAELVAQRLGLECIEAVFKVQQTQPQKHLENSDFRCKNLDGAFEVYNVREGEPVLLIDDASDSGWTFAVIAALLRRENSGPVFPMAIMSTASV